MTNGKCFDAENEFVFVWVFLVCVMIGKRNRKLISMSKKQETKTGLSGITLSIVCSQRTDHLVGMFFNLII